MRNDWAEAVMSKASEAMSKAASKASKAMRNAPKQGIYLSKAVGEQQVGRAASNKCLQWHGGR